MMRGYRWCLLPVFLLAGFLCWRSSLPQLAPASVRSQRSRQAPFFDLVEDEAAQPAAGFRELWKEACERHARKADPARHDAASPPRWVLVTGAGDPSYNGYYRVAGVYHGKPYYTGGTDATRYLYWDVNSHWHLNRALVSPPPRPDYAYSGLGGGNLPASPWRVATGMPPAPKLARSDGPSSAPAHSPRTGRRTR